MHQLENSPIANVWHFFEEITKIPHGSGNEKAISDYITAWGKGKGFETIQDEYNNVIIKKPGTPGYENSAPVVLQGHIDMVCEKENGVEHDFLKDPIKVLREGDFLTADGTTLGGDNGIGVSYTLAVLDSTDISHPPIEALFTTSEEVGMVGATNLDLNLLKGKTILNLDSEDEGIFTVSSAGGIHGSVCLPTQWQPTPSGLSFFNIVLTGLHGGHSGMDIDKERASAHRLMGRLLWQAAEEIPGCVLATINGGTKENAIPRDCACLLGVPAGKENDLQALVSTLEATFKNEFRSTEPGLSLTSTAADAPAKTFTDGCFSNIVMILLLIPGGMLHMYTDMKNLVETSSNMGVVLTHEDKVEFISCMRSSVESRKYEIFNQVKSLAKSTGSSIEVSSDYPAWEYRADSRIREVCVASYKKLTGKDPVVTALHAGLETGIFSEKIEGSDIISIGPDLHDVHSPNEKLSISSSERTWLLLLDILAQLK